MKMGTFKATAGTGDEVVIIHGSCANHEDMTPIAEMLALRYRVTNVDLPSIGQSDWNSNIRTIHDIADTILPELPEQAIYIGWSFGGLVSQSIGARYPKKMKRFIGLGSSPKFIAATDWPGFPSPGFASIFIPALKEKDLNTLLKEYYEHEFTHIEPKPDLYSKLQVICRHRPNTSIEIIKRILSICDSTDLREEFKSLHCPIDLIIGNQDPLVPKAAWEQIKSLNSNVRIHEINGAEHAPFWTHATEFNSILNRILEDKNTHILKKS